MGTADKTSVTRIYKCDHSLPDISTSKDSNTYSRNLSMFAVKCLLAQKKKVRVSFCCHNCTCYYCFCGIRYTEMFAIMSPVILRWFHYTIREKDLAINDDHAQILSSIIWLGICVKLVLLVSEGTQQA